MTQEFPSGIRPHLIRNQMDKARQPHKLSVRIGIDYVTRRFDASSAELKCSWGWTFARTAGERDPFESAYETTIHPATVG